MNPEFHLKETTIWMVECHSREWIAYRTSKKSAQLGKKTPALLRDLLDVSHHATYLVYLFSARTKPKRTIRRILGGKWVLTHGF